MSKLVYTSVLLCLCLIITGCGAAHVAMTKSDLKVQTKMSKSVFMDLEHQHGNKIFLSLKNTSGKDIQLEKILFYELTNKGYNVTNDLQEADYILRANVLACDKSDPAAIEKSVRLGYGLGATATGAAVGALVGTATRSWRGVSTGAAIGAIAGGVGSFVADSLVKDVTFALITDVQVIEKLGAKKTKHEVRIATSANKMNLKFEEAQLALEEAMAQAIANIF